MLKTTILTFVIPLYSAVVAGEVERGIGLSGRGIGASIAANKVSRGSIRDSDAMYSPPTRV